MECLFFTLLSIPKLYYSLQPFIFTYIWVVFDSGTLIRLLNDTTKLTYYKQICIMIKWASRCSEPCPSRRSVQYKAGCSVYLRTLQQGLGDDIVGESESSAGHGGHVTVTLVLGEQRQAGSRGTGQTV